MVFRTNFRLDKNEDFVAYAILGFVFSFLAVLLAQASITEGAPIIIALSFSLVSLFAYYRLALIAYNKTHIEMDNDRIIVSRRPIPNPLVQDHIVSLSGVESFFCEETATSKKEGYDTPRYVVRAKMVDGSHKIIINDVTEDYAIYITQRLEEQLHADADVSRLSDEGALDGASNESSSLYDMLQDTSYTSDEV